MNGKLSITCWNPQQAHVAMTQQVWPLLKSMLLAGHKMVMEIKPETRSLAQNSRLWAMLTEISQQVNWYGKKLTPEDWKHVFTASLKKLEVVPNLDGTGFVALGMSSSKMTKGEMADMQTLMEAFGAEHGVKFSAYDIQEPA
jgi:hypothetical protein